MAPRALADAAQLKFRVRDSLRARLEEAARQRHVSLNHEITTRLENSFDEPPPSRDVLGSVTWITSALSALNRIQGDALDIAAAMPAGEQRDMLMSLARSMGRPQTMIYEALNSLLPPIEVVDPETARARLKAIGGTSE